MLTHSQKLELEEKDGVMLLQGQRADGENFFAYMIMKLDQVQKLEADSADGAVVDFTEYGTVVVAGKGTPSSDHIAYMEKEYNFTHPETESAA
jgi:hypothetical protein